MVICSDNLKGRNYTNFLKSDRNDSLILYVKDRKYLCSFNCETLSSTLLFTFESKVVKIDENVIITENKIFYNLYLVNNLEIANLIRFEALEKIWGGRQIVKIYEEKYAIFQEDDGYFSVETIQEWKSLQWFFVYFESVISSNYG